MRNWLYRLFYTFICFGSIFLFVVITKLLYLDLQNTKTEIADDLEHQIRREVNANLRNEQKDTINSIYIIYDKLQLTSVYGIVDNTNKNLIFVSDSAYFDQIINSPHKITVPIKSTNIDFNQSPLVKLYTLLVYIPKDTSDFMIVSELLFRKYLFFYFLILFVFIGAMYLVRMLRREARLKNDYINQLTHEIKTPLSTIKLAAEAIQDSPSTIDPKILDSLAGIITDENNRILSLVEIILKQSKSESFVAMQKERVDINQFIISAVSIVDMMLKKKQASVHLYLRASKHIAYLNESHFSSVIINLIENSLKYAKENVPPVICITTINTKNGIRIRVKDNGIGISEKHLKKIFKKYYRVNNDPSQVKGFGIGLSYVKNIVKIHGGTVRAESKIGNGTSFIIDLPIL